MSHLELPSRITQILTIDHQHRQLMQLMALHLSNPGRQPGWIARFATMGMLCYLQTGLRLRNTPNLEVERQVREH